MSPPPALVPPVGAAPPVTFLAPVAHRTAVQQLANGGASTAAGGSGGASNGCSVANPVTGTTQDRTITVGTQARTYRLSVPTDYRAGESLPLIFGLNGVGGDGNAFQGCAAADPLLICQHSGGHMWPTGGGDMVWTFFMGL